MCVNGGISTWLPPDLFAGTTGRRKQMQLAAGVQSRRLVALTRTVAKKKTIDNAPVISLPRGRSTCTSGKPAWLINHPSKSVVRTLIVAATRPSDLAYHFTCREMYRV
jgi:hypothetical protein